MQKWYVQFGDKLIGPLAESELVQSIRKGQISSQAYFCLEGDLEWYPGLSLEFFRPYFSGEQIAMDVEVLPERQWVVLLQTSSEDYEQDGPYATREILRKIATGELDYSDRIWRPGLPAWQRIGDLENFVPSRLLETTRAAVSPGEREIPAAVEEVSAQDLLAAVLPSSVVSPIAIEETPPSEALTEDLTKNPARTSAPNRWEDLRQLSFNLQQKSRAKAAELSEQSVSRWLPKMSSQALAHKNIWSRWFAALSLLVVLGLVLHNFVRIEPTREAVAENRKIETLQAPHLRIYTSGLQSLRPQLEIRSNYDREDQLQLEIHGVEGRILQNYRVHRSKSLVFIPGQDLQISLLDENLGDGFYQIKARLGNLTAEKEIFLGVQDVQFETRLQQFNSQKKKRAELEEKILQQVNQQLLLRSDEIQNKLQQKKITALELKSFHNEWKRKFYDTAHTELKAFSPETSHEYVYPEKFRELKSLRIDLWKLTKDIEFSSRKQPLSELTELHGRLKAL